MGSSLAEESAAVIIIGDARNTTAMRTVATKSIDRLVFSGMMS